MKIYIRNTSKIYAGASSKPEGASTSFLDKTNFDDYNDILENPESYPDMSAEVVWLTPDEYIEHCANSKGISVKDLHSKCITKKLVRDYAKLMKSGTKFDMPYLKYNKNGRIDQDGQHRALAAKANGDKFIPVVVVKDKF